MEKNKLLKDVKFENSTMWEIPKILCSRWVDYSTFHEDYTILKQKGFSFDYCDKQETNQLWVRLNLGAMVIKGYSTRPRYPERASHQMQFSDIFFWWGGGLLPFLSTADSIFWVSPTDHFFVSSTTSCTNKVFTLD